MFLEYATADISYTHIGTTISQGSERSEEFGYSETASTLNREDTREAKRASYLGDDVIGSVFAELNSFLESQNSLQKNGNQNLADLAEMTLESSRMTLEEKLKLLRRKEIQQSTLKRKKKANTPKLSGSYPV